MSRLGPFLLGIILGVGIGAGGILLLDDDGAATATTATSTSTTVATELEPVQFEADGVPFTFEYPGTFAPVAGEQLPEGYVAILGISPVNFLDVRRTADTELTDAQITAEIGGALEAPGVDVTSTATRTIGSLTVHVFTVTDTRATPATESLLHFFRAGGRTWELACQSDPDGRATITDACDRMLDSLELTG